MTNPISRPSSGWLLRHPDTMIAPNLQAILTVEDDSDLGLIACPTTDILAWPAIRNTVMRTILGDLLYAGAAIERGRSRRASLQIAAAAMRASWHNLRRPARPAELLTVATGVGLIPHGSQILNRYTDYFASVSPRLSWSIEAVVNPRQLDQRRRSPRITFVAHWGALAQVAGRIRVTAAQRAIARSLLDIVEARGRERIGWQLGADRRRKFEDVAARRLAAYPVRARLAERLLRQIAPRLLLVEDASYGTMAVFNATAKAMGARLAEFQHGLITGGHDAYNVAPALLTSDRYKATQPHDILLYGDWWVDKFNAPIDGRIVIGNPHRSEVLRSWRPADLRTDVLVLGDGIQTTRYIDFCRALSDQLRRDHRVVFRPHPMEAAAVPRDSQPFDVDARPELYDSFASASAVIGEASTALFEAIGLVKHVCVWRSDRSRNYVGAELFQEFASVDEVASIVRGESTPVNAPAAAVWATNWRDRFVQYAREAKVAL
jgi:hypothetical protein